MKQRIALILVVLAFCSGYERLIRQVPVEACAGKWFSDCEVADVGTLMMTRLR